MCSPPPDSSSSSSSSARLSSIDSLDGEVTRAEEDTTFWSDL